MRSFGYIMSHLDKLFTKCSRQLNYLHLIVVEFKVNDHETACMIKKNCAATQFILLYFLACMCMNPCI